MAHALDKRVVLITSDAIEEAPTDIKAYEFISYAQLRPEAFLARLDQALQAVVGNPFAALYPLAKDLFTEFCNDTGHTLAPSSQERFEAAMMTMHASGQRVPTNEPGRSEYLIRRLLGPEPEIQLLVDLRDWLERRYH
jgi:hypothetical protein